MCEIPWLFEHNFGSLPYHMVQVSFVVRLHAEVWSLGLVPCLGIFDHKGFCLSSFLAQVK